MERLKLESGKRAVPGVAGFTWPREQRTRWKRKWPAHMKRQCVGKWSIITPYNTAKTTSSSWQKSTTLCPTWANRLPHTLKILILVEILILASCLYQGFTLLVLLLVLPTSAHKHPPWPSVCHSPEAGPLKLQRGQTAVIAQARRVGLSSAVLNLGISGRGGKSLDAGRGRMYGVQQ